jgi:hypothetical protein
MLHIAMALHIAMETGATYSHSHVQYIAIQAKDTAVAMHIAIQIEVIALATDIAIQTEDIAIAIHIL